MNMIKKNGGFTLVELIVVIAILAILAAIAVPAYSGYITKANEAADLTQLDAIKTAATFAYMEKNPETPVTSVKVVATAAQAAVPEVKDPATGNVVTPAQPAVAAGITVYVNGTAAANKVDISAYYTYPGSFKSTTYAQGATWNSSTSKWTKNA